MNEDVVTTVEGMTFGGQCCNETGRQIHYGNLPQHSDWIYVRVWCKCGCRITTWRNRAEKERFYPRVVNLMESLRKALPK